MPRHAGDDIVISGIGVTTALGQGVPAFTAALLDGITSFRVMERPGRQHGEGADRTAFIGAELADLRLPDALSLDRLAGLSFSARVAVTTAHEAWQHADLSNVPPGRIGLIVGGSNVQQRELLLMQQRYSARPAFIRPTYGLAFMDTDIVGACTQLLGIRGPSFTVGGASASGQVAAIQGIEAVRSGVVDVCVVIGALMDLSYLECQALRAMGAMGSDAFADRPALACRPFDRRSDGFIFGESCGALVLERRESLARRRSATPPLAAIAGWAMHMDANRGPNASEDGEMTVIAAALDRAGLAAADVEYVNPHGTGSNTGDAIELRALKRSGLSHARINTTKSLTGHGLAAAGAVEIVATVVQMLAGRVHPSRNLDHPIDEGFNWVRAVGEACPFTTAITLSHGFGGVNTAVCLRAM